MTRIKLNISQTIAQLLQQEDTDGDKKITIEDKGAKCFEVVHNDGITEIKGHYYLANLLQELYRAQQNNTDTIDLEKVFEAPAQRIARTISEYFWDGLTRTLDKKGLQQLLVDEKSKTNERIIYVPHGDVLAWQYFNSLKTEFNLKVVRLSEIITPEYVTSINNKGGILSLALQNINGEINGFPFVVPGGRFNEMYGWDSYFENIGLLIDGKIELAKAMVENFSYQIKHYGKILNANRSYYLTRTQPPFFSSMLIEVYQKMAPDLAWLQTQLFWAITEYETVWMETGKRYTTNGLNRYLAQGIGLPPETEPGHYNALLEPYAKAAQMTLEAYETAYYNREIINEELDDYFVHDRSVRESGHDTSYRIEAICADLNPLELNCMLFKYETDFAYLLETFFEGKLRWREKEFTTAYWQGQAYKRKEIMNKLMWSESKGAFFDYNHKIQEQHEFFAATQLFPMWAKLCSPKQAKLIVKNVLPKLTFKGGLAGCAKESLDLVSGKTIERQWDYPNGWPPHQIIAWQGLINYGFNEQAQDLMYRWLHTILSNAVNYNGTIPEKFDVAQASHKVFAEYGNQGTSFEYITDEGFGWMNASYQLGWKLLSYENKLKLEQSIGLII